MPEPILVPPSALTVVTNNTDTRATDTGAGEAVAAMLSETLEEAMVTANLSVKQKRLLAKALVPAFREVGDLIDGVKSPIET